MYGLRINTIESLLQGIGVAALPGEKLTVMVGDTVRVHLAVEYRGPAIDGEIHVSYGRQDTWFNEDGNKQSDTPVHFDQSMDWVPYEIACDVPIGGSPGSNYDLYVKIMGVPGPDIFSPTLLNVLDVLGVAEFRDFEITSYEKV
ncbi:unnamed protein product [marine sediment metagenome]|uniref:Arrestin-like N-terminal domain-containing protein n=1 Tax=marine sediment metagenome TaxID=412755 RepID=X1S1M6_9ZZZZ